MLRKNVDKETNRNNSSLMIHKLLGNFRPKKLPFYILALTVESHGKLQS